MPRIMSAGEAVSLIGDGASIHVNGFYQVGTPEDVIDELIAQNKRDLIIANNDGGSATEGIGRLIYAGLVKKLICTWCGLNPKVPELVDKGALELELNPQGTFVERIRAAGYGLGGILTPTGLGTIVEEKGWGTRVTMNNREWLYHTPLKADVCVLEAYSADETGNLIFRRTQRCFGPVMATAADLVIASVVNPIVKKGELDPDHIMVPGALVDVLIQQNRQVH
jgi:acetate CoA/acetoacetate CoA-transferase alpha subunit